MQKKDFVSLAEARPDLAAEWNYEKNENLRPEDVAANSHKKVWWLQYDVNPVTKKLVKLEWQASIGGRVCGCGNPFKSGKKVLKGYNDLATLRPDLASEWNYERNIGLTPDMVTCGCGKKVWWIQYDKSPVDDKIIRLEWEDTIFHRVEGRGNPIKSGRKVVERYNDLKTLRPDLAKEWNYEKNGDLKPDMVTCGSKKSVWWKVYGISPITKERILLEWKAPVLARVQGTKCPFLCGQKVRKEYNDLQTLRPDLAKEWNYEKNGHLKPDMVTCRTKKKVWWKDFEKSPITGKQITFEWQASIGDRVCGCGNPFKSGKKVLKGYNDLQTLYPDIAKEWNFERNGELKPDMVVCKSEKSVWWICYDISPLDGKQIKLEWKSKIKDRVMAKSNPYKTGKMVLKGYNDIQTLRPDLAKEWNYQKNGKLKPDMVTCGSNKKVWWKQEIYDKKTGKIICYEWKASIYSRSRSDGTGNPYFTIYKGEEHIKQYLKKNNIIFTPQQKFPDLIGTGGGQLSYDFSIPSKKYGLILIEYNGIQHYESSEFFGGEEKFKKQKEHDRLKKEYAKKHGYKLIIVKYTYDTYEDVAEYLEKELKKSDESVFDSESKTRLHQTSNGDFPFFVNEMNGEDIKTAEKEVIKEFTEKNEEKIGKMKEKAGESIVCNKEENVA